MLGEDKRMVQAWQDDLKEFPSHSGVPLTLGNLRYEGVVFVDVSELQCETCIEC